MKVTGSEIARVVSDIQNRKIRLIDYSDKRLETGETNIGKMALDSFIDPTIIDCTSIYESLVRKDEPVNIYEDHPCIVLPWDEAAFCYVNEHGNVMVAHICNSSPVKWDTENIESWNDVWKIYNVFLWLGGRSKELNSVFPATGPAMMWRFAIGHQGEPLDIVWIHLVEEYPMTNWDMAQIIILHSLNFLSCINVDIIEPKRPRNERRRIQRSGLKVNEIVVSPTRKVYKNDSDKDNNTSIDTMVPLTSVRGHFAEYGPKYGKGKLFGKYEGRYWIPQHARGSKEHGKNVNTYRLKEV